MKSLMVSLVSAVFVCISFITPVLAHGNGDGHDDIPAAGPIGMSGPADLPLWADILVIGGLLLVFIVGVFILLYFHSDTYRKGIHA
ncbi:MAG TPA: hypothetical protein VGE59_04320 [Patescibacteria group bacterium]